MIVRCVQTASPPVEHVKRVVASNLWEVADRVLTVGVGLHQLHCRVKLHTLRGLRAQRVGVPVEEHKELLAVGDRTIEVVLEFIERLDGEELHDILDGHRLRVVRAVRRRARSWLNEYSGRDVRLDGVTVDSDTQVVQALLRGHIQHIVQTLAVLDVRHGETALDCLCNDRGIASQARRVHSEHIMVTLIAERNAEG